ncbi:MAG: acyl-CoA desaturase [Candidatus Obscuribacterales bacterium]|nr:acyl-CoA desaturase [Steroidobacteraceae bacterium]
MSTTSTQKPTRLRAFLGWFDSTAADVDQGNARRIDWLRVIPFIGMHLACFTVIWVGVSPIAVTLAVSLYALRMFAITGFYHRYFSHKAFRTSRFVQGLFAVLGAAAVQRGPLWWAAHHRHHHAHADETSDPHSPQQHGFVWAHTGWFLAQENFATRTALIKDLTKYPELRLLDRFDILVPVALAAILFCLGIWLEAAHPNLGTSGAQLLVWGFCISTVVLYHATFTVNSLAHTFGTRRFATRDTSRNNPWLALLTFGEGWHNNHHHYPGSARQGFYWWEFDLTYYGLRLLAAVGLIWDLRTVPHALLEARRVA